MPPIVIHRQTIGKPKYGNRTSSNGNFNVPPGYYNALKRQRKIKLQNRIAQLISKNKKVGTLKNNNIVPVFKGPFGGFFKVIEGNFTDPYNINVPKNRINFNQKFLNNRTKPQGKWWWSRMRSKAPNGAPVYKNTITGAKATSNGNRVNNSYETGTNGKIYPKYSIAN
jgi:hypothetical protein